jgi:hypothetical protein
MTTAVKLVELAPLAMECPRSSPTIRRTNSINRRKNQRPSEEKKSILKRESTQGNKKSLSFAVSIEMICHFLKTESPRNVSDIPPLYIQDSGDTALKSLSSSLLIPEHWKIVSRNSVSRPDGTFNVILDQTTLGDNIFRISILTKNLAFEKSVFVRLTTDNWETFEDAPASFNTVVQQNIGKFIGLDNFCVNKDLSCIDGEILSIQFAIRYTVNGVDYWDNNRGQNYRTEFERKSKAHSTPKQPEQSWIHTHNLSHNNLLHTLPLRKSRANSNSSLVGFKNISYGLKKYASATL